MFHEIANFSYQRTPLQAFGWYLMYALVGLATQATTLIAFSIGTRPGPGLPRELIAALLSMALYHILLGTLLLWHRKRDTANIALVVMSAILSIPFGAFGGLIPLCVLTCYPVVKPSASG